ncbi:hypothetical protein GCM10022215_22040 [Nocardioides fonticola]|uniref:Phospholipid/cholesterol/gamma-HCH transport system substrate-binding protein n=1 Tax=Nocardioides fonticola TaxID=450363 RepID=A0ABP7XIV9_9ACTN
MRTSARRAGGGVRSAALATVLATSLATGLAGCRLQPNDNTLPGQTAVGSDGYSVTVTFDQVENLVPNSTVLYDDVTVGTVAAIEVRDWQAVVTLRLKKDVPIPANATFAIGQKTLLGAQYVEVDDPARPQGRLAADAVVPVSQTGDYPETEQVLGAASLLLNNGGLSQLSTITTELNRTLDQRVPDTRDVVAQLNELLGTLDDNRDQLIATLESLDALSSRLADGSTELARAVDRVTPGLRTLNRQRDRLVEAITRTGEASVQASRLIAVNQDALVGELADLRPAVAQLSTVADQLPDALKLLVSVPFPIMTSGEALKGDYANLFATIDISSKALAEEFLGSHDPDRGDTTPQLSGVPEATTPPDPPVLSTLLGALGSLLGGSTPGGGSGKGSGSGSGSGSGTGTCGLLGSLLGGCR